MYREIIEVKKKKKKNKSNLLVQDQFFFLIENILNFKKYNFV